MTIQELLIKGYEALKSVGIESYMLDTQLILAHVLKEDKLSIMINRDKEVDEERTKQYLELIDQRAHKMPVKYITGECEFMGLNFKVRPGVLIPRPDTEILVEAAVEDIKKHGFTRICDVCCGSGAIGLSIANYVQSTFVDCCDISDIAVAVTRENAERFSLKERMCVVKSDLLDFALGSGKTFQAVVSNPPYIKDEVIPSLMDDVRNYEPYEALSGGSDGLDFYRKITEQSLKVLESGGLIAFEIGYDQREAVSSILKKNGFKNIVCLKDLAGNDRVVKAVFGEQ